MKKLVALFFALISTFLLTASFAFGSNICFKSEIVNHKNLINKIVNKDADCVQYVDNIVNFFEHENSSLSPAELQEIHDRTYYYYVSQKN
ncbi:MAG: hypothetical protein Q4G27_02460 [Flavobacteriaceae bacterium]|nr:hypothetical protein [Flavobacteriaceae bacterium]